MSMTSNLHYGIATKSGRLLFKGNVPNECRTRVLRLLDKTAREISHAIEKGKVEEGRLVEHQDGDGGGEASEAEHRDRPEQSGQEQ